MHNEPNPLAHAYQTSVSVFAARQTGILAQIHAVMDFIDSAQWEDVTPAQATTLAEAMKQSGYKAYRDLGYRNPPVEPMSVADYIAYPGDPQKAMLMHAFMAVQSGKTTAEKLLEHEITFTFGQFIDSLNKIAGGETNYVPRVLHSFLRDALTSYDYNKQAVLTVPRGAVAAPAYRQ